MNNVTVDDNAFDSFLTKKSRLKYAEKRTEKGKKPLFGIGNKQLANKNAGLPMPEDADEIDIPSIGGDYPNVEITNTGGGNSIPMQTTSDVMMGGTVQEAGFFGKNKKTLMIVGGLLAVGSIVYFGFGKKLGIRK